MMLHVLSSFAIQSLSKGNLDSDRYETRGNSSHILHSLMASDEANSTVLPKSTNSSREK